MTDPQFYFECIPDHTFRRSGPMRGAGTVRSTAVVVPLLRCCCALLTRVAPAVIRAHQQPNQAFGSRAGTRSRLPLFFRKFFFSARGVVVYFICRDAPLDALLLVKEEGPVLPATGREWGEPSFAPFHSAYKVQGRTHPSHLAMRRYNPVCSAAMYVYYSTSALRVI